MTAWWSTSPEPVTVPAGRVVSGRIRPPSSKSLTHRAGAIALLSRRPLAIVRPLDADDTRLLFAALAGFGFAVRKRAGVVEIEPPEVFPARAEIDCGNAGTLFRFLVALAATVPAATRLDGVARLRERPAGPLVEALRSLGVEIDELGAPGCAPLVVHGGRLSGGRVALDAGESSQYLSALLLAGQRARGPLEIEVETLVSAPYVELTIEMIERQGGTVERIARGRYATSPSELRGGEIEIEPDVSAAAYPAAAAAITGGRVEIEGVSRRSKQGDRRLFELLERMGAAVDWRAGGVTVEGGDLVAIDADLSDIPDQVPTLAALAPFARGTTVIRNVAHLRIKESDRLAAMSSELRRAGAGVEELEDGLVIPGLWAGVRPPADRVTIDPRGDHRIAMALALVGLRRPNLAIADPDCVAKSYPGFWRDLARILKVPS